jgi:hypothetical protein
MILKESIKAEINSRCPEDPLAQQEHISCSIWSIFWSLKYTLADNTPRLVGIYIVADDLGGEHKGRSK